MSNHNERNLFIYQVQEDIYEALYETLSKHIHDHTQLRVELNSIYTSIGLIYHHLYDSDNTIDELCTALWATLYEEYVDSLSEYSIVDDGESDWDVVLQEKIATSVIEHVRELKYMYTTYWDNILYGLTEKPNITIDMLSDKTIIINTRPIVR